jgi:hypothetical protein
MRTRHISEESGFSLAEALVAMTIMTIVMGGVFHAMATAMDATRLVKGVTSMNQGLALSMDAMVRDLTAVGQGLPVGRRIGIPSGGGAQPIIRPGPGQVGACPGVTTFPAMPSLAAVSAGAGKGPAIEGVCTDVITVLMADSSFENVGVAAIAANGTTLTIDDDVNISDANLNDNIRAGDFLMLTKGSNSTLMAVTQVANQVVTFGADDRLRLNQFDTGLVMQGTINQLRAAAPVDTAIPQPDPANPGRTIPGPTVATRIRMVTYYVDTTTTPEHPRLTRILNAGAPNAIGFEAHGLRFSFDLFDGNTNPTAVAMTPADLVNNGPCGVMLPGQTVGNFESQCANKIRKVNVMLAMRSANIDRRLKDYHRNTLFTQVALRNLTFSDQY